MAIEKYNLTISELEELLNQAASVYLKELVQKKIIKISKEETTEILNNYFIILKRPSFFKRVLKKQEELYMMVIAKTISDVSEENND
jgi:hypothetical protein